jgi:alkaline phosphatase D
MRMKRRTFLKATLVTAGHATLNLGCGSDSGGDGGDEPTPEILEDGSALFPQSLASGDPTPESVVLWTRVIDPAVEGDREVSLQLALDEEFLERVSFDGALELAVVGLQAHDHCIKLRVGGLAAATTHYYRFVVRDDSGSYVSRTGRTRTAPAPDADVPVRFAFVSCQDYGGRYYNPYKELVNEEFDFFVHLGDYVYETTGDPQFQETSSEREVTFTNPEEALALNSFLAARSLSNYRDLYKTFRSDPWLQQMHERFAMVATWDDHEFSDDCHGAEATYLDGAGDEEDVPRRKNANQAWFEFMPVDYRASEDFEYDPEAAFPGDLSIYRDFRYGRHMHLVMTDLRTWRADHPIGEDELPGAVALDADRTVEVLGEMPDWALPYVDIDDHADGLYKSALEEWAVSVDVPAEVITGFITVEFINATLETLDIDLAPITEEESAALPRGVAISHAGKNAPHGQLGTRYLGILSGYEAIADARYDESGGASEEMMGQGQEAWFLETMQTSDATWKVWGNEFPLFRKVVDLSTFSVPLSFQKKFLLSLEDWGGVPNKRDALLDALADVDNVVAVTGDVHAFFVSTPHPRGDASRQIVEFVGSSVSSGTYQELLFNTASSDPALVEAGAPALALLVEEFLQDDLTRPNPDLRYANVKEQGYAIAEVSGESFDVLYRSISKDYALEDLSPSDVSEAMKTERFQVRTGSTETYREIEGEWSPWDAASARWSEG